MADVKVMVAKDGIREKKKKIHLFASYYFSFLFFSYCFSFFRLLSSYVEDDTWMGGEVYGVIAHQVNDERCTKVGAGK